MRSAARRVASLEERGLASLALADLFVALGHPTRVEVIRCFDAKAGDDPVELSAKDLAVRLELPATATGHHVKRLREAGLLHTVRSEPRRGSRENYQALTAAGVYALKVIRQAERTLGPAGIHELAALQPADDTSATPTA